MSPPPRSYNKKAKGKTLHVLPFAFLLYGLHQHILQGTNDNENNVVLGKTTSKTQPLRQVFPLLFDVSTSTIKAYIPPHNKIIHTVAVED